MIDDTPDTFSQEMEGVLFRLNTKLANIDQERQLGSVLAEAMAVMANERYLVSLILL